MGTFALAERRDDAAALGPGFDPNVIDVTSRPGLAPAFQRSPTAVVGGLLSGVVTAYALSLGVVPWTLLSEIFPLEIRERAVSVAVLTLWTTNLLVTAAFAGLTARFGAAGVFLLFAVIRGLGVVFGLRRVPETRGRPLEEIRSAVAG